MFFERNCSQRSHSQGLSSFSFFFFFFFFFFFLFFFKTNPRFLFPSPLSLLSYFPFFLPLCFSIGGRYYGPYSRVDTGGTRFLLFFSLNCFAYFYLLLIYQIEHQIREAKKYLKTMGLSQDRSKYNHNQVQSLPSFPFFLFLFLVLLFYLFYFILFYFISHSFPFFLLFYFFQMVSRREVFDSCDLNKDGTLTETELLVCLF